MENSATTTTSVPPNKEYLRTPPGILRLCEAVLGLGGLISGAVYCTYGPFPFFLFLTSTSIIRAVVVLVIMIMRLDTKIAAYNVSVSLSLLVSDGIDVILYFVSSILVMLAIGECNRVTASIFATLFSIALFLVMVGLVYLDYIWYEEERTSKEPIQSSNGTTITESSPTVVTLN